MDPTKNRIARLLLCLGSFGMLNGLCQGSEPAKEAQPAPAKPKISKSWYRLAPDHEVWVDMKAKCVIVGGQVCQRQVPLEMFACPKGTGKEHESVVSVNTPARYVHAGLVALGAKPGPPVQFDPEYKPAQGTEIEVEVVWIDADATTKRMRAQEWVKNVRTQKALSYPWVFAGSMFLADAEAKERYYCADGGEFICVSNFSTAMLDLPVESSDTNSSLLFSAFTENIPPRGTPVQLILTPHLPQKTKDANPPQLDPKPEKKKALPGSSRQELPAEPSDDYHGPLLRRAPGETFTPSGK